MSDAEFYAAFPNVGPRLPCHKFLSMAKMSELEVDAKESKAKKVAQEQKDQNYTSLFEKNLIEVTTPHNVEEEVDDRKFQLHSLRFDRYPTSGSRFVFSEAGKFIKVDEYTYPISDYGIDESGITCPATSQGVIELHNPRSKDITIKQFKASNRRNAGVVRANLLQNGNGMVGFQTSTFLEDCNGVQDVQHSFKSLTVWMARIRPYDRQLEPVWEFLIDNHWLQNVVWGIYERLHESGHLCGDFVDECLHRNATLFGNNEKYLDRQVLFVYLSCPVYSLSKSLNTKFI